MIKKHIIKTPNAPDALGPYSQGIVFWNFVFTSMELPIDPKTGKLVSEDLKEQTKQVIKNIKAIMESGGSSLEEIVKMTVYINDINNFPQVNEAYEEFFPENPPARALVVVSDLPLGAKVAMDAMGVRE